MYHAGFSLVKEDLLTSIIIILLCEKQPQNLSDVTQHTLTFAHETGGQLGSSVRLGLAWVTLMSSSRSPESAGGLAGSWLV